MRLVNEHLQDYPSVTAASEAVAKQLGVGRWVVQAHVDGGGRHGVTSEEHAEIKKLKSENGRLREDNEILKAATVYPGEVWPQARCAPETFTRTPHEPVPSARRCGQNSRY